jgi:hypothetical protein
MKLTKFSSGLLTLLSIASVGFAQSVTISWVGGKNGAWETAANWQTNETPPVNRVPINGDSIQPMASGVTISYSATTGTQNLGNSTVVQRVATSTRFLQTGGTLNVKSFLLSSTKAAVANGHINYELRGGILYSNYRSTFTWDNASDRASRFLQTGGSARFGSSVTDGLSMAQKSSTQQAYYDLQGGSFDTGYLKLGSGGANQTVVFTQSGGSTATVRGKLYLGTVAGATGQSVYNLDGGTLTMSATPDPFVFTQPGAPVYFDFDGGILNLRGSWNFASLTAISNSDFRVQGKSATVGTLVFKAVTINGLAFTRISGCEASASKYGIGLAGKNGIPTLTASAAPKFGTRITVTASNSSGALTPGLVLLGVNSMSMQFLGGNLLVVPLVQTYLSVPAGGLVLSFTVPSGTCQTLYIQALQLDAAAAYGVSMSPGLRLALGL